ncbi:hypothetical protein ATANTOWER_018329 [Ataeniobius toweri]|uniref:Tubulin-specific chaperone A n=1 Tax=Ataeniobius toweri TaxID=208326 RepID=A0ABU7B9Y6_9TELE|nr:hypothetical protein [Ataeniobius toweri]
MIVDFKRNYNGSLMKPAYYGMEVLQESRMMIPDCRRRLAIAHADLLQLLETEEELAESEEYNEARNVLDSVKLEG